MEYQEENLYRFECFNCSEKNAATLLKEKFEILFDFGSAAFLDGYYREAVANFATALERFFEFFVRTVCRRRGIDDAAFDKTWKLMAKQSERQLGAFAALYLLERGTAPDFLDPNQLKASFRNAVVHGGRIPSRKETIEYADMVYDLLREQLLFLCSTSPTKLILKTLLDDEKRCSEWANKNGYNTTSYHYYGMFGLTKYVSSGYGVTVEDLRKALQMDLGFEETALRRRQLLELSSHVEDWRTSDYDR
jgi:hypothetical protein